MYRVLIGLLLSGPALTACADEQAQVFSGPQAGESLPPFRVSLAFGEDVGHVVDYVKLADGRPSLLVIVNGANRPAAALTRSLMNFAEMQGELLFAGVVYLDDDVSDAGKYLRQAIAWWGVSPPVGVSVDGAEGPGAYGLNRNVNLTILVAHDGRVLSNFALIQPSLTDGPKILADVTMLIGGRVPTKAEMAFLSSPTRKLGNARWQAAPSDVAMRRLICDALAAGDDEAAQVAAAAVDSYVSDNKQRQAVLGTAAAGLLNRKGYAKIGGVPIEGYLRGWRDDYYDVSDKQRGRKRD
ncbi:MAG: hypothetical protein ABGZ17_18055 [Planctomycetaceae bacterium]